MGIGKDVYRQRRDKLAAVMRQQGIAAARFEDFEHMRSPSLRYLCGHPGDAFLVVDAGGTSILVAWDRVMADKMAYVDRVFSYTDFGRNSEIALRRVLEELGIPRGANVELPSATAYPRYVDHVAALDEWDLLCRNGGMDDVVVSMRSVKDSGELEIYEKLSSLTNNLIGEIEEEVRRGSLATETEVALFIEREARRAGAEGTGFDTIAAGPERSFGIHAFPSYGAGPFGSKGFSILDFGVVLEGYTSDVTMSFVRGPLKPRQERMLQLVREAYTKSAAACGPGVAARQPALVADEVFAQAGFTMPHSLGHGIGLEAHEAPGVNLRDENDAILEPGTIITIEPGLYDPELGGIRWENDILITEDGARVLTESKIVEL
ncbi:MAG: Xaa-Pro peptidase family protein [Spirochaetia bacterium]|jgi:Xaa-Pro dipeptidase|nr:Xaa-Pro peptidase family protein [Spirochaetia bacterium]